MKSSAHRLTNRNNGSGGGIGGGSYLLETLKSSFLFNFRTGNVLIDTFVTGFIICLSTYVMSFLHRAQNIDFKKIVLQWIFGKENADSRKIIISSKLSSNVGNTGLAWNYSPIFNAIVYRIKQLDCDESQITELCEIPIPWTPGLPMNQTRTHKGRISSLDLQDTSEKAKVSTNLIVSQLEPFKVAENVVGRIKMFSHVEEKVHINHDNEDQQSSTQKETTKEYQITIQSSVLSMNELRLLVQTWVEDYLKFMEPKDYLCYFLHQCMSEK